MELQRAQSFNERKTHGGLARVLSGREKVKPELEPMTVG